MLIRNAVLDGYPGPVDLRLMHGAVQEIGVGLVKGLYESEIDLGGDRLAPCPPETELPKRFQRRAGEYGPIRPGSREPFLRMRGEQRLSFIHQHSAD